MSQQRTVVFPCDGKNLIGIIQDADSSDPVATTDRNKVGIVFLHGWSGYRVGPHQMFVHTARVLAQAGYPSLRFDFRGRGDSEGDLAEASLITMVDDVRAAVSCFLETCGVEQVVLIGICSGAEVAFGAATVHPAVADLALWSAPIFWAEAAPGEVSVAKIEAQQKTHYLKEYLRKLILPTTWKKLFSGKLQFGLIARVLLGRRPSSLDTRSTISPQEFRDKRIRKFADFKGSVFAVYGTHDPTTEEALKWYRSLCEKHSIPYSYHLIQGANHSYYSLQWEREVIEKTVKWLNELKTY